MPDNINVLVTGLAGGGVGMQIIKALNRSELPLHLTGADMRDDCYGRNFVDDFTELPSALSENYFSELKKVIEQKKISALFIGSEPELKVLADYQDIIAEMNVLFPIQKSELLRNCLDKVRTSKMLAKHGFAVPAYAILKRAEEIENIDFFPLICKPGTGGGGSKHVYIAQNKKELKLIFELHGDAVESLMVQEYKGRYDQEYTVGVLSDMAGNIIDSIAVKRNIMSALSNRLSVTNKTGKSELGDILAVSNGISQGEIGRFEKITSYCEKVAFKIGSRGPINFQCRVDDEKIYIFEINPRFSGTTSLRALAGLNEPELLIKIHILNEEIEGTSYREGTILRGLHEEFVDY